MLFTFSSAPIHKQPMVCLVMLALLRCLLTMGVTSSGCHLWGRLCTAKPNVMIYPPNRVPVKMFEEHCACLLVVVYYGGC
jgi:hypothetical protein